MNKLFKTIYLYIVKSFLVKFLAVTVSIALLIFIINLVDVFDKLGKVKEDIYWFMPFEMAMLQVPVFVEDISIFIVLVASMITLLNFSTKSEITVMRSSGLSLWQILLPLVISSFILGLFFILIFNPLTIFSSKRLSEIEERYIETEEESILTPDNGIWLRQKNILKENEVIIIRARKVYMHNLHLKDVNLWFFDAQDEFYKKIDAKEMFLKDDYWQLDMAVINDGFTINKKVENLKILTNLESEFILKKVINNFENVKSFSIFYLPGLIKDLEESGFSPRKFRVYYYSLLNRPFMFISMVLMAAFFSINNVRNKNNILYVVIGIMGGLVLYVGSSIVAAFGSSGLIPPFAATWIMSIIFLTATILLIFKKEKL